MGILGYLQVLRSQVGDLCVACKRCRSKLDSCPSFQLRPVWSFFFAHLMTAILCFFFFSHHVRQKLCDPGFELAMKSKFDPKCSGE